MQIDSFKAENNYVIIEAKPDGERTLDNGLVIVEKGKWDDLLSGNIKVLSNNKRLPDDVTVGSTVFFLEKNVKSRFFLDSIEYLTIKDEDLLAVE